ncbi:MAG: hypothetical protein K2N69_09075 [Helicobacter sp.]|nr:hypothetical protein [Helicobacter sp.]
MTLTIENVKEEFVPTFKTLAKSLHAKCRVEKQKTTKFEKKLLKMKKELEAEKSKGTAITFESHQDFKKAIEDGKI